MAQLIESEHHEEDKERFIVSRREIKGGRKECEVQNCSLSLFSIEIFADQSVEYDKYPQAGKIRDNESINQRIIVNIHQCSHEQGIQGEKSCSIDVGITVFRDSSVDCGIPMI